MKLREKKRAEEATNAALLNPLIDEYSLRGAKGLLVNITGGNDLTLFEVDEAVNKIRAEVDPEADLIFGSIEDESLNGKIRVSIVATSLDGQEPQIKPVISMVHRLHNRNTGYSDNSKNLLSSDQPTLMATEGATALDINTTIEENNIVQQGLQQEEIKEPVKEEIKESVNEPLLENISLENATYLQNVENISDDTNSELGDDATNFEVDSIELVTPELFSENSETDTSKSEKIEEDLKMFENSNTEKEEEIKGQEMFEEINSEEDFEIPAFLRRQKN